MSIGQIFTRPELSYPAEQIADGLTVKSNQIVELFIDKIKEIYHEMWAVTGLESGASRNQEEQQAVIDKLNLKSMGDMREASFAFVTLVRTLLTKQGGKELADRIIPECYLLPAWDLTPVGTPGTPEFRVVVGQLKSAWVKPLEEEEQNQ